MAVGREHKIHQGLSLEYSRRYLIKVGGAGPAGLTAAINLAESGYEVTVYERASHVGARHSNDFQGLENWSRKRTVPEILGDCSIRVNFLFKPFREMCLYSPSRTQLVIKNSSPLFYLVVRGDEDNSLDKCLEKQAIDAGVKIEYNTRMSEKDYDIVATGPRKAFAYVIGYVFQTSSDNVALGILDDQIGPKGLRDNLDYIIQPEYHHNIAAY